MKNSKTFDEMIEQAKIAIMDSTPESSVYVGCDSLRHKKGGKWHATYSTVVVLHMNSKNGGKVFHFTETHPDYALPGKKYNPSQRLLQEVYFGVNAAVAIIESGVLGDRKMEVHIDVNSSPEHKSYMVVKEAIGYARGTLGFDPKIKPFSWAATHAGDHVVRH